jgi:anti-sigma-K factor RskA
MNEDQEVLAAEYVLGTLDADERARAQTLVETDGQFADLVQSWERRLGELQAMVDPVEPAPGVWERIRINTIGTAPEAPLRLPELPGERQGAVKFSFAARNLHLWRATTAAAAGLAVLLALYIGLREFDASPPRPVETAQPAPAHSPGRRFIAVLQRDPTAPAFLMTVDVENRMLTVRRVAAAPEPGRSYELWLVSDKFPQPRSLGLVGDQEFTVQPTLASYDADTISRATYAVSLEPQGGSPTGTPSGPVLFTGSLIEATPN